MSSHSWNDRKVKEFFLYKAHVDMLNLWEKGMSDIDSREALYSGKCLEMVLCFLELKFNHL